MGSVAAALWSSPISYVTLRARHQDAGALWVLELSGEADIATLPLLRHELYAMAATADRDAVVDVKGLTFCDVASARLILGVRRTVPVTVCGATGSVKRVFDLLEALQAQRLPRYLAPAYT